MNLMIKVIRFSPIGNNTGKFGQASKILGFFNASTIEKPKPKFPIKNLLELIILPFLKSSHS